MDKNQELRTNIVLTAQDAINAVKDLADGLDRIAQLKFDNVKTGFDSLTKAFQAAQKMSTKVAKTQIKDEEEVQTHLQKRAEIINNMMKEFSKQKTGLSVNVDMSAMQKELVKTTRLVADMYDALGQTPKAKNLMTESLNLLTKLSNAGMKGIGLEAAKREYKDFERQIQENKNMRDELDRQVAAGIAEKRRQQMVKEGKDPLDDPVYAKSEAGKKARQAMKQQAKEEAEALEQARAEQRAKVAPALEESKAARKARENAKALNEQKAKERAKQAEADKNALQKRLKEMEEADAKELAATAKKYAKQKKQREQAIADTEKRQEKNKEEWMKVWDNIRDMDNNPHRNDLYKTTGSYTPEMNRRKRQEQEQSALDSLYADSAKKREKVLEKEAQFRRALAEATNKAELDLMKSQDINSKRIAQEKAEREQALANARLDNEKRVQAAEKQNEERRKKNIADAQSGFSRYFAVSDRSTDFHDKIDFLKSSGKKVSESELFRLEKELEKIRRKALDIGATDIASKLTKDMLKGLNVVTEAQKKATDSIKSRRREIVKLHNDYKKLLNDIEKHRGIEGQSYSKKAYDNTLSRIDNLRGRAESLGQYGTAQLISPALLNGVNTKLGQFNARLSESKDKAQQLYMKFRETGSAVDKLNFMKAVNEFKQLDRLAEDFNEKINKTKRSALTLSNIAKRAKEHFNWTAGAYIENTALSFPSKMVETISKYELAMAGVAQVIPLAEEGQGKLNSLFADFSSVAAKYGQSVSDAMESAKSIGRMYGQGEGNHEVGAENTRILTAQAAKMATVDNFNMLDATKGLESALSQFDLQTEKTNLLMARSNKILDVWTKLAHTSGASAQDLTQGVARAGAAAHQAGVSFEFLNSLVAVGVRSTAATGNEIGNTLKSMFSSILSDKNIKNMERFGIQVYTIGKNGQKQLRGMQDIILDISKALATNPNNIDVQGLRNFMMDVSGGKQQYSKIAAILKNYKEIKRTMGEATTSAGFTDKQLDLQMNTISRKFETLKANIDKLFVSSGEDGLANDLKWILDVVNRLATAMQSSETHFYKWAKYGTAVFIAWKALPALFNSIAAAAGRASVAFNMKNTTGAMTALTSSLGTTYEAAKDKQMRKMQGLAYNSDSAAVNNDSAAIARNTTLQNANTLARQKSWSALVGYNRALMASRLGLNLVGTGLQANTVKFKALSLAARAGGVALSGVAVAWRGLGAAVTALGGPLGAIMALVTIGITAWSYLAEQEQKETEVLEKKNEAIQKNISLAQESIENADENVKFAQLMAEKYNKLVDEQKELEQQTNQNAEANEKHKQTEEQLKSMQEELKEVFHASSIELDQDGKINKTTIDNLAKAHREAMRQKLQADRAVILSNKAKAEQAIANNSKEIESLKNLTGVWGIYAQAISFVHTLLKAHKKANADKYTRSVEILDKEITKAQERGDDAAVKGLQERREKMEAKRQETQGDYDDFKEMSAGEWWFSDKIAELEAENKKLTLDVQKTTADLKMVDTMLLSDMKDTGLGGKIGSDETTGTNHYPSAAEIRAEQNAANKARSAEERARRKAENEANKKRPYLYDDDESKAFSKTAKHIGGSFSNRGVDTPTLQAIASALNGGNFAGVADPFHNGATNVWDSSYNFAEQLKERFRKGHSLETALNDIFDGWGITWDTVIEENVAKLKKKFNYKSLERYWEDPTEKGKQKSNGGDNLALADQYMNDPKYGHNGSPLNNFTFGEDMCVVSSLEAAALFSPWAAEKSQRHYAGVAALAESAMNDSRVTVKPYNGSEAKTGDIVIYVNSSGGYQHAGFIAGHDENGNAINYDNATSAGYSFIRRSVANMGLTPKYLIHDNANTVMGDVTPSTRWDNGSDSLQSFSVSSFERFQYAQEKDKELYESTKARLELEEKITGYTAEIGQKIEENENLKLMSAIRAKNAYEVIERTEKAKVNDGLDKYKSVAEAAGGKENFFNLPDSKKKELAKLANEKSFEQAVSTWIAAQKAFIEATKNLDQLDYEHFKKKGFMNPEEEEDFNLQALDLQYESESSGKIFQDPRVEEQYHRNRAEVYQHRLDRLEIEKEKANAEAPQIKENLRLDMEAQREVINEKKAALAKAKTPEEIANATKELETEQRKLELQAETWRNVEAYGTEAQRKVALETAKTKAELNKETMAANKMAVDLQRKLGNGVKSMFSDVLMEGKSFKDAWKNLWTDIGKFALDRLLEIQLSRWIPGLKLAGGGSVSPKANGGLVGFASGGYTDGLIQGAGTGTSDSILTYLAHRGQFIATSNGEYIIKKSSVDKLGVGFLDTLNNNPEAIGALNGLKRYANGGNLGESYAPSMSLKGINGYKTFNKSNMEKQMSFSTRKMETLLQGLRQDVQDGNKSDNSVAQPIILNTQADSASVMKAIAKNPRALQAIMGNNQRRGFR